MGRSRGDCNPMDQMNWMNLSGPEYALTKKKKKHIIRPYASKIIVKDKDNDDDKTVHFADFLFLQKNRMNKTRL